MTKTQPNYCTIVDDVALRAAIRLWMCTSIIRVHTIGGVKQDLYIKIIALAIQLPYEETFELYQTGDQGLQAARRKCKRIIFNRLTLDPPSILCIHDEVVVHEVAAVESGHASQELEDHTDAALHSPA